MYSRWPISVLVRPSPTNDTMVCSDAVSFACCWAARLSICDCAVMTVIASDDSAVALR
jgi:hypothetical protein